MRIRPVLAVPAVSAAAAAALLTAPQSQAAERPAPCTAASVTVRAAADRADTTLVRVRVTNHGTRACTVDRLPTVTFGGLDGSALPVPAGESGPYRIGPGRTAYAAVRTIADTADPEARRASSLAVSGEHWGRTFPAARLGTGRSVRVWEPVTTWWKPSAAAADRALGVN
ncbi:DUF4232 domain-containing protein [Streptomyces sp. NPDC090306]|uniref:DUF4232 domain-containing protein n=1 Tax=unclassified Streptomyces TaxID=2593676 RepID=UPI0036E9C8E0